MSSYVPCACRDCFDIAITGDDNAPALCLLCKDAGCVIFDPRTYGLRTSDAECQRPDAYGVEAS